jgi:hypothetical protein
MKAYALTSGVIFAAIGVAHVAEVIDRSRLFASDVVIVLLCAGLAVWAWWAWRVARTRA